MIRRGIDELCLQYMVELVKLHEGRHQDLLDLSEEQLDCGGIWSVGILPVMIGFLLTQETRGLELAEPHARGALGDAGDLRGVGEAYRLFGAGKHHRVEMGEGARDSVMFEDRLDDVAEHVRALEIQIGWCRNACIHRCCSRCFERASNDEVPVRCASITNSPEKL